MTDDNDPCGGTGFIVFERTLSRPHPFLEGERLIQTARVTARCLCHKGQHGVSPRIPLICDVVETTEQLQELFPHGIPTVDTPLMHTPPPMQTSALCRCGHKHKPDGFCSRCPCMTFRPKE